MQVFLVSKDVKWPYVTVNYDRVGSDVLQTMVEAGGNRFYPTADSENDSRRVQMLILVANPPAWEMPPVFAWVAVLSCIGVLAEIVVKRLASRDEYGVA